MRFFKPQVNIGINHSLLHGVRLEEPGQVDRQRDGHGRQDVEEAPVLLRAHALVVVREAHGQIALDGHGDDHVDAGAERDAVEGVVEPREDVEEELGVERGKGVAEGLHDAEEDVEAVARHQGWREKNMGV